MIVYTGIRKGMWLALVLTLLGWGMLLASILGISFQAKMSSQSILVASGPLLVLGMAVTISLLKLARSIPATEPEGIALVKRAARLVPVWMTGVALTSLWACGVLFWFRSG